MNGDPAAGACGQIGAEALDFRRFAEAVQHHIRTPPSQGLGNAPADAARGTCDQRDLPLHGVIFLRFQRVRKSAATRRTSRQVSGKPLRR